MGAIGMEREEGVELGSACETNPSFQSESARKDGPCKCWNETGRGAIRLAVISDL